MGLERTALPTFWGWIGPECLNLTVPFHGLFHKGRVLAQDGIALYL